MNSKASFAEGCELAAAPWTVHASRCFTRFCTNSSISDLDRSFFVFELVLVRPEDMVELDSDGDTRCVRRDPGIEIRRNIVSSTSSVDEGAVEAV